MSGAVHPAAPAEAALSAPTRRDGATRQHARIREVNVLSLLAIIVCTCAVTFLSTSTMLHVAFTCALFVLMAAMGFARAGAGFLLAFAVTHAWLALNVRFDIGFPSPMAFTFVLEMLPLLMPVYLLVQAPSGKLMASLRQLPIPSPVLLAVIVILRFMPTMLSELADVRTPCAPAASSARRRTSWRIRSQRSSSAWCPWCSARSPSPTSWLHPASCAASRALREAELLCARHADRRRSAHGGVRDRLDLDRGGVSDMMPNHDPQAPAIELAHLTFAYEGSAPQLEDVNLTVQPGEVVVLTGPSAEARAR
ncbi:MAG: hypothetical protein ACLSVD_00385 [Eggerthellaceae bacterium]